MYMYMLMGPSYDYVNKAFESYKDTMGDLNILVILLTTYGQRSPRIESIQIRYAREVL